MLRRRALCRPLPCQGNDECVKILLGVPGVDANAVTSDLAFAPLSIAAFHGHADVVRTLLGHGGIDINRASESETRPEAGKGSTALLLAAQKGYVDIVHALLAADGIDASRARDDDSGSPLSVAEAAGHEPCAAALRAGPGATATAVTMGPIEYFVQTGGVPWLMLRPPYWAQRLNARRLQACSSGTGSPSEPEPTGAAAQRCDIIVYGAHGDTFDTLLLAAFCCSLLLRFYRKLLRGQRRRPSARK